MRSFFLRLIALCMLAACTDGGKATPQDDTGADGFTPDPPELCNGADDDGDGRVDEGTVVLYADQDGDGFGWAPAPVQTVCEALEGYVADNTDCDDGNATVFPGAAETCNAADDDCDGTVDDGELVSFLDADGDGFGLDDSAVTGACPAADGYAPAGGDCDDADPLISPGAADSCGDAVDSDCDIDDGCVTSGVRSGADSDVIVLGSKAEDLFGYALVVDADYDGDGVPDVVVGAPGYLYRAEGKVYLLGELPLGSSWADDVATVVMDGEGAAGAALAGGLDVNGDGLADLAVGMPTLDTDAVYAGAVAILAGPLSDAAIADAGDVWFGAAEEAFSGASVAGADFDGDGYGDVVVGAHGAGMGGEVYVLSGGPARSSGMLRDADTVIGTLGEGHSFGVSLATGDIDGDGREDLAVGAMNDHTGGVGAGAVYVFLGSPRGAMVDSDADVTIAGANTDSSDDRFGEHLSVLDVDHDGAMDLAVSENSWEFVCECDTACAYDEDTCFWSEYYGWGEFDVGRTHVFAGPILAARGEADAALIWDGPVNALADAGDVDGDGISDLWLGGTWDGYHAYLLPGTHSLAGGDYEAQASFVLDAGDVGAYTGGYVVSVAATDRNGDGHSDLLAGVPVAAEDDRGAMVLDFGGRAGE